jgi:hypothetical protein
LRICVEILLISTTLEISIQFNKKKMFCVHQHDVVYPRFYGNGVLGTNTAGEKGWGNILEFTHRETASSGFGLN